MFKKMCKALIIIPLYVILLLEGFFGGWTVGKYCDPWIKIKKWIMEDD